MTTAREIVYRAHRLLMASTVGETPTAEDANEMLAVLNGFLSNLSLKGMDYTHSTLTLDSTIATPASIDFGLPYLLALIAAPHFETQPSESVAVFGTDCLNDLRKLYIPWSTDVLDIDTALKRLPGLGAGYLDA